MSSYGDILVSRGDSRWISLAKKLTYMPYEYTNPYVNFLKNYRRSFNENLFDISRIITIGNKPIALFPICKYINKNIKNSKLEILKPLFIENCNNSQQKKIYQYCFNLVKNIMELEEIGAWECSQSIPGEDTYSPWTVFCLNGGASIKSICPDMYINLDISINEIRSKIRKSYRSLINPVGKDCKLEVLDGDLEVWDLFNEMHITSAGRLTRSLESWNSHKNDLLDGNGLLVYALDLNEIFLGGSFYGVSRDEAVYSVAAFNRERRDLPLGHLIKFKAIQELKSMNLKWCRLGTKKFLSDSDESNLKEILIGDFKSGFCTHYFPRVELIYINTLQQE